MIIKEPDFQNRLHAVIENRIQILRAEFPRESYEELRLLEDFYRLVWRLAFDLELRPSLRHYAASLALYIVSAVDFVPDNSDSACAYVDDLAVAVRGTGTLLEALGREEMDRHWRSAVSLDEALGKGEQFLTDKLPCGIEDKIRAYLRP
ncbi:MAG: hypothetical protein KA419_06970 [Acidobacteria bacterium]|nr:hypothetical protein [Acidobacteriota bacterium]